MENRSNPTTHELMVISRDPSELALELIKGVLVANGIALAQIVETDEKPFHYLSVYFPSAARARSLKRKLGSLKIKGVSFRIKALAKKDWFNKWKTQLKPFQMGSLRIVPAWHKEAARRRGHDGMVVIDTGFAFGSGLHPTTRYMAALIERSKAKLGRFLDIGTGSGILSLIALKNGAVSVEAIDISADAVESANANFIRNGFIRARARKKDVADFKPNDRFDFVAANLITKDLIDLKRKLCALVKKGGWLAVSGISVNNLPVLKKEFRRLPLACAKTIKGEGWCAILYRKT